MQKPELFHYHMIRDVVTNITELELTFKNGVKFNLVHFKLVHNLKEDCGPESFKSYYDEWADKATDFTAENFIKFVKDRQPNCIFQQKSE